MVQNALLHIMCKPWTSASRTVLLDSRVAKICLTLKGTVFGLDSEEEEDTESSVERSQG